MTFKPFAIAAAMMLGGAANAATQNFYYSVLDANSQDVGLLMISDSPTFREAALSLETTPQYNFAFGFNPSVGYPGGDIQIQYVGGVMNFEIDLFVCNPNYGNCNFSTVWFINGQDDRGELSITNYPDDPNSYSYALIATVPEPPNLALILAGAGLAGVTIRRRNTTRPSGRSPRNSPPT